MTGNLAEIALELRLAECEASIEAMSYACKLEAMVAGARRSRLELDAASINLSPESTRDVLDIWDTRAKLIHEAHVLVKALIPLPPWMLRFVLWIARRLEIVMRRDAGS